MKIGFIGVGNIGNPMAARLLAAGHDLTVHDLREAAAANLVAAGASWSGSPGAVAARCEVVATCLPGPAEVERVALGPDGLLESLRPGTLYVDHTTSSPLLARRIHALMKGKGIDVLDAPVSGGMEGARTGDLLVMVGGEPEAFQRARPVLEAMARRVVHTGASGAGCICKIMHNSASFTLDLIMAECWTVAVKAGVAPETIVEVFRDAALGRMMSLNVRLPATFLRGDFDARFALRLARKDLGLALELARAYDVPTRLATLCEQELTEAMARGWGDRDSSIFLTLQEERARTQVRLPPGGAGEVRA